MRLNVSLFVSKLGIASWGSWVDRRLCSASVTYLWLWPIISSPYFSSELPTSLHPTSKHHPTAHEVYLSNTHSLLNVNVERTKIEFWSFVAWILPARRIARPRNWSFDPALLPFVLPLSARFICIGSAKKVIFPQWISDFNWFPVIQKYLMGRCWCYISFKTGKRQYNYGLGGVGRSGVLELPNQLRSAHAFALLG